MIEFEKIINWFSSQCDGDWEHENSIKIYTTDNPGWGVSIDISNTHLEGVKVSHEVNENELKWFRINSDGNTFQGFGGVNNLKNIFLFFLNEFMKQQHDFIYDIYGRIEESNPFVWRQYKAQLINDNNYVIQNVPEFDVKDLKFENFEEAEQVDFETLNKKSDYLVGDQVICELKIFADYPANVIKEVISQAGASEIK